MRKFKMVDLVLDELESPVDGEPPVQLQRYLNKRGSYVDFRYRGRRPALVRFVERMQISPIKRTSRSTICSIGKSAVDGKWYGWSHRAMVGFAIGDRIFEENYGDDRTPFIKHGRKVIRNDADARKAASAFAASVS